MFIRRLGEAAVPGGWKYRPCPDFASNTLAFALQLMKIKVNLSQGNGPQQAVLHLTSHAYQLCQPANGRAGWTASDWKKKSPF